MKRSALLAAAAVLAAAASAPAQLAGTLAADGFEHGLCSWSESLGSGDARARQEGFPLADGSPWPAPWTAIGDVAEATVEDGEARWLPTPSGYSLGRLYAPIVGRDFEVTFTLRMEDAATQGVGFYVRQNGGYLQDTTTHGAGYAVFVEGGFRGLPGVSLWKEQDGVEIEIQNGGNADPEPAGGVAHRARFRVTQLDAATTRLRGKLWPAAAAEPAAWTVSADDATAALQNVSGGVAVDSWSVLQGGIVAATRIDDVEVRRLCHPLDGIGGFAVAVAAVPFAEGPLWRQDHLLYTALDSSTIHRLDPPAAVSVFRNPSGVANGLALAADGALLAAEHAGRRLSRTDPLTGTVTTLVDEYQGAAFNSPNDLAVRWDGTVYFTDPDYGLANPGDRELAFNGLFRLPPAAPPVAEWQGVVGSNQPNGIALAPDQDILYATDTQSGTLRAWDVAADGALSNPRVLASGIGIPDGVCVDHHGNVWVAAWGPPPSLHAFSASGEVWGALALPSSGTNCAFGGADRRALYVTTLDALLVVEAEVPGEP